MSWIKRNLGFVISGALGLVLLGLSGWYVYTQMQADQAATETFEGAFKALHDYQTALTFPNDQNLELAKKDLAVANQIATGAKSMFPSFQQYKLDNGFSDQNFKNYIEATVDSLQQQAKKLGVTLPTDYYFTFSSFRKLMTFEKEHMAGWIEQMEEIKTLVSILIKARVNTIDSIRRVALSDNDAADNWMDFMSGLDSVTNAGVIRTPYEITFSSFSGELAGVLEGLMRSSNCFLIKNLQVMQSDYFEPVQFVEPTTEAPSITAQPVAPVFVPNPEQQRKNAEREFYERYHQKMHRGTSPEMFKPPPPVAPPVAAGPPKPPPPPVTVLSERPLQVTIFLEILKLEAVAPSPVRKNMRPNPRAP